MNTQLQKQYNILLIGEICKDYFYYGIVERISPEAPVPIFNVKEEKIYAGMAGNVQENLQGLGANVYCIHNFEEIRKDRYVDQRFNQHVIRIDKENNISPFDLSAPRQLLPDDYFKPDAIIISDYNKGFLPKDIIRSLLIKINMLYPDCDIFVDSKKTDLSCFTGCFIKLNEKEFKASGKTVDKSNKLIVTLGKKGAKHKDDFYPVEEVETFDVSGAGDTFLSAFVMKYLETKNIGEGITYANKCASFVVKKTGTYAIKKEDMNDLRI